MFFSKKKHPYRAVNKVYFLIFAPNMELSPTLF